MQNFVTYAGYLPSVFWNDALLTQVYNSFSNSIGALPPFPAIVSADVGMGRVQYTLVTVQQSLDPAEGVNHWIIKAPCLTTLSIVCRQQPGYFQVPRGTESVPR